MKTKQNKKNIAYLAGNWRLYAHYNLGKCNILPVVNTFIRHMMIQNSIHWVIGGNFSNTRYSTTLQWRHDEHDGDSNHRLLDCLLNRLIRRLSKKTSQFRVIGLCEGNPPVIGEFSSQRTSNAENVSIWWRHHATKLANSRCWSESWFSWQFFLASFWC